MIQLYTGSGARDIRLVHQIATRDEWAQLRQIAKRLLRARKYDRAAKLIELYPFEIWEGTNTFNDEFQLLYFTAPPEEYAEIEEGLRIPKEGSGGFREVASVIGEISEYYIRFVAVGVRVDAAPAPVPRPQLKITSEAVEHALGDAEELLRSRAAVSAVDRAHTAVHGYLWQISSDAQIKAPDDASITQLFKRLRAEHPRLKGANDEVGRILSSLASIVDSANTIRNRSSLAHPNEQLLADAEAMVVINSLRTLLHYLDAKLAA